jgi:tetratricopeptide (TPR) repeat protein
MSSQRANQLIEAGLWLRLSGDAQGAQRLFERALQLDPGNARAKECLESTAAGLAGGPGMPSAVPGTSEVAPSPLLEGDWGAWAEGMGGPEELDSHRKPFTVYLPEVEPGTRTDGDAMELLARDGPKAGDTQEYGVPEATTQEFGIPAGDSELDQLLRGAEDLLELDDHSGAVDLLFKAQELAPGDPRVEALRQRSEKMLMSMLESKLGDLGRVPTVKLQPDDIIWLNLDHRAGFVLAQIDGSVSYEDLFALSGMTRLDTARILAQLLDEGVIAPG